MNIIKHKNIFFLISAIVIVPGLISLVLFGIRPSIDFTGGSRLTIGATLSKNQIQELDTYLQKNKVSVHSITEPQENTLVIRTNAIDQKEKNRVITVIKKKYKNVSEKSFETVGALIGSETTINALKAVAIASVAIMLYIAFVFRKVSKPVASWKYGACAIIALLHDVLFVLGAFSLLGYFFHVEVDSLFITALLTVMGFSVHDTIVVFDRIRENLHKDTRSPFETIVNDSILQTLNRSLNTSITIILVLFMLFLFGAENTRWFIVALLLGIISGTYSSIFNAAPLLVAWYQFDKKRAKKA